MHTSAVKHLFIKHIYSLPLIHRPKDIVLVLDLMGLGSRALQTIRRFYQNPLFPNWTTLSPMLATLDQIGPRAGYVGPHWTPRWLR